MYVIIEKSGAQHTSDTVLNIMFNSVIDIRKWILEYLTTISNSLLMSPNEQFIRNKSFSIEENNNTFTLIQSFKQIHPGYVYNTSYKSKEIITIIQYLEFDGTPLYSQSFNCTDTDTDIYNRVLKKMDQDSLYQFLNKIQDNIHLKNTWTITDYTSMITDTLKNFKKELYSNITKKSHNKK